MKYIKALIIAICLVILDQLSKYWVLTVLKPVHSIPIINGVFSLTYLENRGAIWGIMQGQVLFFAVFTCIILIGAIWVYSKIPNTKKYFVLQLIDVLVVAGAIGNLIDRVFRHFVVDFLYFELIDFPIFNIADIYVTVAAALCIIVVLFVYKDEHDFDFLSSKKGAHS